MAEANEQLLQMTRKVIIDTDPGVDDAIAIFLALSCPEIEILGISTIFGNADTRTTTRNALSLTEIAGREEIPVSMGALKPLSSDYLGAVTHVHGHDGQGNANLGPPQSQVSDETVLDMLHRLVLAHPKEITLLTLGPLTNLALVAQQYPEIVNQIAEIVVMGGNALSPGNANPVAEANLLSDPEAADIVFGLPWRTTMIGLDVTHRVNLSRNDLKSITTRSTPISRHLAAAIPFYQSFFERTNKIDGIFSHDPTAVTFLIAPDLFETHEWPVRVETEGFSRGKSWPSLGDTDDSTPEPWRGRPKVRVATDVDSAEVRNLIVERLALDQHVAS